MTTPHTHSVGMALSRTEEVKTATDTVSTGFSGSWGLGKQLGQISRLIKARDLLETEQAVFYTQMGGFDTHSDSGASLSASMKTLDSDLKKFR